MRANTNPIVLSTSPVQSRQQGSTRIVFEDPARAVTLAELTETKNRLLDEVKALVEREAGIDASSAAPAPSWRWKTPIRFNRINGPVHEALKSFHSRRDPPELPELIQRMIEMHLLSEDAGELWILRGKARSKATRDGIREAYKKLLVVNAKGGTDQD
jgi:hypothetical protein